MSKDVSDKDVKDYASQFVKCPAAQIFHKMLRNGAEANDMKKLLKGGFTPEQTALVDHTSYDSKAGFAKIKKETPKQLLDNALKGLGEETLGLTDEEIFNLQQICDGSDNLMSVGETQAGAFDVFNINSGLSLSGNKSYYTANTKGHSIFSVNSVDEESEEGSEEEVERNTFLIDNLHIIDDKEEVEEASSSESKQDSSEESSRRESVLEGRGEESTENNSKESDNESLNSITDKKKGEEDQLQ